MMDEKGRQRLKVLDAVVHQRITQKDAAAQLRVSERGFRKLLKRYRETGDRAVVHGLLGQESNRRVDGGIRLRLVEMAQGDYQGFAPKLLSEYFVEQSGIAISRETVRQTLIAAGIWEAKPRKISEIHEWRRRRSCFGELVQWDTSVHDWLEGRGPRLYLIAMIDDATSRLLARFEQADDRAGNMRLLRDWIDRWGLPVSAYTDKAGHFVHTPPAGCERAASVTQIHRALNELGIELIVAHSPQAKGRIERAFQTLQDRLVKALRLAGAATLEEANKVLAEELARWERQFVRPAASVEDAHRPLRADQDLASILSLVEHRSVANDYTLQVRGLRYQIAREQIGVGLRGAKVRVETRLDGTLAVRWGEEWLQIVECGPKVAEKPPDKVWRAVEWRPKPEYPKAATKVQLDLKGGPGLGRILGQQERGEWQGRRG